MKRSPPHSDFEGSRNGVNGAARGVHDDLYFDATPRSHTSYSQGIQGQRPANPPPLPASLQPKPPPQQPPFQWAPPTMPPTNRFSNANQEIPGGFLDMPEPGVIPVPSPLPTLPPGHDAFAWNTNGDPRRPSPQPSPAYGGPLDTFPSSLSAGLPQYATPPPPLPPKTPVPYTQYTQPPPPLPPRGHDPYHNSGHYSLTPPKQSPSPRISHDEPGYYPQATPPSRPSTGANRLTPEQYPLQRPSSHSGISNDVPFFVPPTQRPTSAHGTTPPRYYQHPEPYQQPHSQPVSYSQPQIEPYRKPSYPASPPQPQIEPYRKPSYPTPSSQQPQIEPYRKPSHPSAPQPQIEPYRRPSHPSAPQPQIEPYRRPSHPSSASISHPPQQSTWRPSPPQQKRPPGPLTSNPPPTSLVNLRHLPYPIICQPSYHRETIEHPQHFAKSSLLKINVFPAENTTFVAGGEIYGRVDISCKGEGGSKGKPELLLGELGIELTGYDESKAEPRGSPARSHIFLVSRRTFQTPFNKSAPLDKITNAIAYPTTVVPDDAGYRQPARANSIFPFRFILPSDIGSAIECGQEVRTRYTLTGYAKVRILGSFETLIDSVEVDVVEQLPYNHIYRNPNYKSEEVKVKDSTEKSFRGKMLAVEASIPKKWYKAGESVPITLILTPTGHKKVGWIKASLINRVTINAKAGEGKEVAYDFAVSDTKIDEDTDFDPEKPSATVTLSLQIPKTCRTVSTALFDVKQYIKVFILHNVLSVPFSVTFPLIDIIDPASLEPIRDDGENYSNLAAGGYIVREIDTKGGSGKIIQERHGTNRPVPWDWYVDKIGRSKVF